MEPGNPEVRQRNGGMRFFAASILLIVSCFALRSVFITPKFERIFSEMLNGAELPVMTMFLIRFYPTCAVIPLAILAAGCGVLLVSKRPQMPFYVAGICLLLQTVVSVVYFSGLYAPFAQIISEMNAG